MIKFTNMEVVGPYLPHFFNEDDPRPAKEQVHTAYSHGGGWNPFNGFKLHRFGEVPGEVREHYGLKYPGDPIMRELSRAKLRDELLVFFECSWLAIIQPDSSWEVARLD